MSDSEIQPLSSFDNQRPDLAPYGLTCVRWRPSLMPRPDRHNELEVNLLREGSLTYLIRGQRVTVLPGRLTVFWALEPHQIIAYEGEGPYYVATIPLSRFLHWRVPSPFVNQILTGAVVGSPDASLAQVDVGLFERWFLDVTVGAPERIEVMLFEMEARLRRLALSYDVALERGGPEVHIPASRAASSAEHMAAYIAAHYQGPLSVLEIAEAVGLHPDYANVVFRQTFGTTLGAYVRDHRIAHVERLLTTTDESVTAIAFASGFNSLSRFNATFKAAKGCTPSAYRRRHLTANGATPGSWP